MHIHDVLIIGAGPCSLAVAARLHEQTPFATFTDDEHQRYHWIRKHGRKVNIKNYKTGQETNEKTLENNQTQNIANNIDMIVLDAEGDQWLTRWKRLFKTFDISHLRSPMFFHVDPADRDALLGYAYENDREKELQVLPGCVGQGISKHRKKKKRQCGCRMISQAGPDVGERDRKDYFTPSKGLFDDHCDNVERRYGLRDLTVNETVTNVEYGAFADVSSGDERDSMFSTYFEDQDAQIFKVSTSTGTRYAHIVILAVGPGNAPSIPLVRGLNTAPKEAYSHAMSLTKFPPPRLLSRTASRNPTSLMVIGGGLTSIQLSDLALSRGISTVYLLTRSALKVKYFDVDLEWVGKFRNVNQASFWSADSDEERFEMLGSARGGGSITPRYRKVLDQWKEKGRLIVHERTQLVSVRWDRERRRWADIKTEPPVEMPATDYIIFATGVQTDITTIPFLQSMHEQYPIRNIGGLPCLNDDLMWKDDVPLFATGRLAGLRLGPGAPNLVGARIGAERIAWNVSNLLDKNGLRQHDKVADSSNESEEDFLEYAGGRTNRFDSLVDLKG